MLSYLPKDIEEIADRLGDLVDEFSGTRVMLTGGCGFLGRYFIELFRHLNSERLKQPCQLTILDNFITSDDATVAMAQTPNIRLVNHDVINPMEGADFDQPVDFIIHAAGIASPFYYRKYPLQTLEVATIGTKNALRLCEKYRSRAFLYFSSSEIYGDPDERHVPTPESYRGNVSCLGPRACYDEAKRVGETLCMIFHQQSGVPTKSVRPFNVYGPGMRRGDYRVLPNFAAKIVDGEPVSVYSQGRQTRTYCYIVDAIAGFTRALLQGIPGEVYNIGNPSPEISVLELVKEVEAVLGRPIAYRLIEYPDSYPADEPMRRCPDISKAIHQLGYKPSVALRDGLDRFLAWAMQSYPETR
ncbi:MAG: UDP-glucuronate decarboxylase [Verrucomicrobiota bacterium]|jgi:UDP-glucuronate decarboxylase